MKVFFIVLFSFPALGMLRGNDNPLSQQASQVETRSGNQAMQQFKLAQKNGNLFSTEAQHREGETGTLQKPIQVDLSETSTAFEIMVHLTDDSIEEDFSFSYRDGHVKVKRKNNATNSSKSSEVMVKLPGPGTASMVTRFTRDGKLIFNLPKTAVASLGREF